MEYTAKPKTLVLPLIFTILTHSWPLHSQNQLLFAPSPSPSPSPASVGVAIDRNSVNPYRGRKEKPVRGSFPATCHSKCNQCRPCVAVEVSIRTMAVEENQYYPMVWKCMCQSNIFSP